MGKECRFCKIASGELGEYGMIDSPILEEDEYFSVVSIGAFIDDWTLVVTKEHVYNLHQYYAVEGFLKYLQKHIEIIKKKNKETEKVIIFEHGANKCESLTACGTSHAHLHIIPFSDSILEEILNEKKWTKIHFDQVQGFVGDKEYLLYGEISKIQKDMYVYVHIVDIPESQYFRRILAEKIGLKSDYSYKIDERKEESLKIRKKYEDD